MIFTIIILALLAAIALPKFLNIKDNALINSMVFNIKSSALQTAEAARVEHDLNNKSWYANCEKRDQKKQFCLKDVMEVNGRYWKFYDGMPWNNYDIEKYQFSYGGHLIAEIGIKKEKNEKKSYVYYFVICNWLPTKKLIKKCKEMYNGGQKTYKIYYY
jgi:hypothetical protein